MPLTCAHCDRPVDGNAQRYCPQCGQPTPPPRIDWHFLGHELEHSVLHMDRGLLFTLRELMLRPGRLLHGYLAGKRNGHAKPLLMIMLTAAAVVLAMRGLQLLHPDANATLAGPVHAPGASDAAMASMVAINTWMERNYALATLLLLPLEAACFRLVFGQRAGLNYPEWLVVMALLTVQTFVLLLLGLALAAIWPQTLDPMRLVMMVLALGYGCASLVGLFPTRPAWRVLVRSVVAFALFLACSAALAPAIGLVVALVQQRA